MEKEAEDKEVEEKRKEEMKEKVKEKEEKGYPQLAQGFVWLVQQNLEPWSIVDWLFKGKSLHSNDPPDTYCHPSAQ